MRLEEALPLLSAWGLAIEAGEDGAQEYANLMALRKDFPVTYKKAVLIAEGFQKRYLRESGSPFTEDSPLCHPGHRLRRVRFLKQLAP